MNESENDEEVKEIIEDSDYGESIEEKEVWLKYAKYTANFLNWSSVILCLWAITFPEPYQYVMIAVMSLPLLAIAAIKYFKGLIRIDGRENGVYSTLITTFIMASGASLVRALVDFNILNYTYAYFYSLAAVFF